jgi:hypothetical protein
MKQNLGAILGVSIPRDFFLPWVWGMLVERFLLHAFTIGPGSLSSPG